MFVDGDEKGAWRWCCCSVHCLYPFIDNFWLKRYLFHIPYKKYSRKGKLTEKNSCAAINPKKYSCNGLNKIHAKNLITKKNSCSLKIPLPPITFLMVRPLSFIIFNRLRLTGTLLQNCPAQVGITPPQVTCRHLVLSCFSISLEMDWLRHLH